MVLRSPSRQTKFQYYLLQSAGLVFRIDGTCATLMRKALLITFRDTNFLRFVCLSLSATVVWLTILPTLAEDPITLESEGALELLEAQILKNQENSAMPTPAKPSPTRQNPPLPMNPAVVDGTRKSESSEESLPPPAKFDSVQIAPALPYINPSMGPAAESVDPQKMNSLPNQAASPSGQPFLGLTLQRPSGNLLGLRVVAIADRSPAWKSGFQISDRVLAVSDQAISSIEDFAEIISDYAPGDQIRFLVDRNGTKKQINSVLMDRQLADRSLPGNEPPATRKYEPVGSLTPYPSKSRSFGVAVAPLSTAFRNHFGIPAYRGASVLEVRKDSPASQAGLHPGDCIVAMNNEDVQSDQDVLRWQLESEPGEVLPISFYRGGSFIQAEIVVPGDSQTTIPIPYNYPSADLPLGATIRPQLSDSVQAEILELRREVERLRDQLRAAEQRR